MVYHTHKIVQPVLWRPLRWLYEPKRNCKTHMCFSLNPPPKISQHLELNLLWVHATKALAVVTCRSKCFCILETKDFLLNCWVVQLLQMSIITNTQSYRIRSSCMQTIHFLFWFYQTKMILKDKKTYCLTSMAETAGDVHEKYIQQQAGLTRTRRINQFVRQQ